MKKISGKEMPTPRSFAYAIKLANYIELVLDSKSQQQVEKLYMMVKIANEFKKETGKET